uniref:Lipase domain-containing protein n=1 Tax=Megaselia scalaris TaxID=36166 RepID=T1GDC4_MEGSC
MSNFIFTLLKLIKYVAETVAKFIDNSILSLDKTAVIGLSLSAHIAGLAARYVKKGYLFAVWGLDPAGPLFSYNEISWRISGIRMWL